MIETQTPEQCQNLTPHTHDAPDEDRFDGYLTRWDSDHIALEG